MGPLIFTVACGIISCGMWDLVPQLRIEPRPSAVGAWSLSHWTTREVPDFIRQEKMRIFKCEGEESAEETGKETENEKKLICP